MPNYRRAKKAQEACLEDIKMMNPSIHDPIHHYRLIFDVFIPQLKKHFGQLKNSLLKILDVSEKQLGRRDITLAQTSEQLDQILEGLNLYISILVSDQLPELGSKNRCQAFFPIIDQLIERLEICHQKKVEWRKSQETIIKEVLKVEVLSPDKSPETKNE